MARTLSHCRCWYCGWRSIWASSVPVASVRCGPWIDGNWLMALGCATWDSGQLEQEIAEHDWLITPSQNELVFDHEHNKWHMALALMGIKPHQLSGDIGHA